MPVMLEMAVRGRDALDAAVLMRRPRDLKFLLVCGLDLVIVLRSQGGVLESKGESIVRIWNRSWKVRRGG